jgi:hypothetical protein
MTTLKISITKEVLEATKDCPAGRLVKNCAISYVVRSIWPIANTTADYIRPFMDNRLIPIYQRAFITRFDRATPAERAAMQPFDFIIEVPDEVIGEVNISEIREILKGSKTLELV